MKKTLIISGFVLAILVIIFILTSMGDKSAYDNEKTHMAEGEERVTETEVENTELVTEEKNDEKPALSIATPEHIEKYDPQAATATDRTIYAYGFYYEPLSEAIKEKITGVSFHENDNITYEDLRYLNVLYVDFEGNTQKGEIICNKAIAQDLVEIFKELYDNEYQIDKIRLIDEYGGDDDLSCDDNNTSCFNYRVVGGTDSLSKHALGLAIDINPFQNPYITYPNGVERISPVGSEPYADRTSGLPHMILEGDLCYNLFIEHGFTWGGHWKTLKDYQHFQKTF